MWQCISEQISENLKNQFVADEIHEIQTGDSQFAYKISDGNQSFFVKTNKRINLPNFEAESEGLQHLANPDIFTVPKVICSGLVAEHSFLVLEYLKIEQSQNQNWLAFGQALAELHQSNTQNMYGWQADNFIGLSPQSNIWQKKWSHFFAEQRIGFMLQLLAEKGFHLANIDKVVASVERLLSGHSPVSSMLHGDLWQGNVGFVDNRPTLYDPAFYFGDRETDIAMTELFGRFPENFYHGYNESWPLDDGYQYRKPIYQLYHVLNHGLLFGGNYIDSAKIILKNLD